MGKKQPAKGHHGLGARGQGKLVYFHGQVPEAAKQPKEQRTGRGGPPQEHRRDGGRWVE
ncbi:MULTISPECIES: hypothetical protein [Streptomyces]|uniref:Uncharacterized protein n=2 Tax=Streptomyces TaxID=1883 RepID=A0A927BJA2_STRGL|nr:MULTISPECIES: hypothetical protein [Streptomyces]MBD2828689.1 hypothetical protein [Streptomyces globisporus]MYW82641.1 hypothetical protein [Streptomyces sp. SID8369]NEA10206.1 hypothetical protein [Streptomyces sp. SID10692]NEC46297.1 hypothetical protein [Streptomyces sp. SID8016]MBD3547515.1 hypothetical protein [Streptomyces sp. JV180]